MGGYIGNKAVGLNVTTGDILGDVGVGGVVTANAGVVVDNITIDGTTIALSSGDLTLDVAGDIILDADGAQLRFRDGGTEIGVISNSSNDLQIVSSVSDADMIFRGNDGGTPFNALTLDMSDAGTAIFNHDIVVASANGVGDITLGGVLRLKTLDDAANQWLVYNYNDDDLHFHFTGSGSSDVIMHNDGDLQIIDGNLRVSAGHGIDFAFQTATSATNASTTSELLDHYEEGTCTLVVAGAGGGTRTMGSNNKAFYTRVGRLVTVSGTLHVTGGESLTGTLKITGIPFDADPASNHRSAGSIGGNQLFDTGDNGTHLTFVIDPNAPFIWVLGNNDSTPTFAHLLNAAVKANQHLYGLTITYMTDA